MGFGKKARERKEMIDNFRENYKPVGYPVTGKDLLFGELSPDGSTAMATSEEAYKTWMDHYNIPMARAREVWFSQSDQSFCRSSVNELFPRCTLPPAHAV